MKSIYTLRENVMNIAQYKIIIFLFLSIMTVTVRSETVGYLGCSLTQDGIQGALRQGDDKLWKVIPWMVSGALGSIADGDKNGNFESFKYVFSMYPVSTVWWQVCAGKNDAAFETYNNAAAIIDEIRAMGVTTIYVSAPPRYTMPRSNYCRYAGEGGQERVEAIVAQLVASGDALNGPVVGPLDVIRHTRDKCHGNQEGQALMGSQLMNFGW